MLFVWGALVLFPLLLSIFPFPSLFLSCLRKKPRRKKSDNIRGDIINTSSYLKLKRDLRFKDRGDQNEREGQRGRAAVQTQRCWVSVSTLAYVSPAGFFLVWSTWWPCALIGSVLVAMETQPWVNDTPSEHDLGKRQETRTSLSHTHIQSNTFWPVLEDSCFVLMM